MHYYQPPEVLKKLIENKNIPIESLIMVPHAVYYALASIPMPWQQLKYVEVAYQRDGSISLIRDKYRLSEREYRERWRSIIRSKKGLNVIIHNTTLSSRRDRMQSDSNSQRKEYDQNIKNAENEKSIAEYSERGLLDELLLLSKNETNKRFMRRIIGKTFKKKNTRLKNCSNGLQQYIYGRSSRLLRPVDILPTSGIHNKSSRRHTWVDKKVRVSPKESSSNIIKELLKTKYFYRTKMEWTEALLILLVQGQTLLRRVLYIKKLSFLTVDDDFNLINNREITTKERKRSRLGMSFHFTRELFKMLKSVADLFIKYRSCSISQNDLCTSLKYLFTNVGTITGIYRYKYKVNKQIRSCKDLNTSGNDWAAQWKVWANALRGYIPYVKHCLTGLIRRITDGRAKRQVSETKQRADSGNDIRIKGLIKAELGSNPRVMHHFNEMWRSWKADIPYVVECKEDEDSMEGVSRSWLSVLEKYCEIKGKCYIESTISKKVKEKNEIKKQNGRVLRLHIKNEKQRQKDYLQAPFIKVDDAVLIYRKILQYFGDRRTEETDSKLFIGFPEQNNVEALLIIALKKLKKRCSKKRKEFYNNIDHGEYIHKIKKNLLSKRIFGNLEVGIRRNIGFTCYYTMDVDDQLTDGFLAAYLWKEAIKQGFFPSYFVVDCQFEASSAKRLGEIICNRKGSLYTFSYKNIRQKIDMNLLRKLLRIIMAPCLAEYIISRCNCKIVYKDMEYSNYVGLIGGFEFSSFVYSFWSLCLDIVLFKPNQIQMNYLNRLFILKETDLDHGEFIKSIKMKIPPSCGSLVYIEACQRPYKFELGGLRAEFASSESKSTILIEKAGNNEKVFPFLHIKVTEMAINRFKAQIKEIVRKSVGATFLKIVNEWNRALAGFCYQYENAINFDDVSDCEIWIRRAIQKGVNSKMPARFPMVIFYAPLTLGGLGMLSTGNLVIEETEKRIPNILDYCALLNKTNARSGSESVLDIEYRRYLTNTHRVYDIHLFGLGEDMNVFNNPDVFGGVDAVLSHTLFKALNAADLGDVHEMWDMPVHKRGTRAQKNGLSALPNRRFIFWWSPVLNRSHVYLGYKERVDRTGVFLYGKLNSLKTLFLQVFRGRLWDQIHNEVTKAVISACEDYRVILEQPILSKRIYTDGAWIRIQGEAAPEIAIREFLVNVFIYWSNIDNSNVEEVAKQRYKSHKHVVPCMMCVVDLCYSSFAICGCNIPALELKMDEKIKGFIEKSRALEILRERLRVSLSVKFTNLELSECEMHSFGFICELSGENIFIFNPKNGNLYYTTLRNYSVNNIRTLDTDTSQNGSVKNRIAFAVLSFANEIGVESLAIPKEMSMFISRHATSFPNIITRPYGVYLHLSSLRQLLSQQSQVRLKKTQNLYFPSAGFYTSFFRLKLILKAATINAKATRALGVEYSDGWNVWNETKWGEAEKYLERITSSCDGIPGNFHERMDNIDSELFWVEDYALRNKRIFDGSFIKRLKELTPVGIGGGCSEPLPVNLNKNLREICEEDLSLTQIVGISPIRIPYNVIAQFYTVANTKRQVRAYIEKLSPFTIVFLPQYINTFVELPRARGIITNVSCDYKEGIHIILGEKIVARRWCGNIYSELPYIITDNQGLVFTSDWNFNFRIESFERMHITAMKTSLCFYNSRHRERHFKEFIEKIEKLKEKP